MTTLIEVKCRFKGDCGGGGRCDDCAHNETLFKEKEKPHRWWPAQLKHLLKEV